jgi:hypothetical protein
MDGTLFDADPAKEIDVGRYKADRDYRRQVHEDLEIADDDDLLDLEPDSEDEELAFNSGDYPTDEAAQEALSKWMNGILKEVLDELAAENSVQTARSK